jgi:hypothetical protein
VFNASVYTLANVPGAPTLSNPTPASLQLGVALNGNPADTKLAVQCSATTDPSWQGKFVDAAGQPVAEAVWQTATHWDSLTLGNLQEATEYCFQVKARNGDWEETNFSGAGCAQTTGGGLLGDINCDGLVDFGDINPFVLYLSDFAAWQAAYAGCPATNGDINGDGLYPSFDDINPFVALLTGAR